LLTLPLGVRGYAARGLVDDLGARVSEVGGEGALGQITSGPSNVIAEDNRELDGVRGVDLVAKSGERVLDRLFADAEPLGRAPATGGVDDRLEDLQFAGRGVGSGVGRTRGNGDDDNLPLSAARCPSGVGRGHAPAPIKAGRGHQMRRPLSLRRRQPTAGRGGDRGQPVASCHLYPRMSGRAREERPGPGGFTTIPGHDPRTPSGHRVAIRVPTREPDAGKDQCPFGRVADKE
jgi:hypothetical protein